MESQDIAKKKEERLSEWKDWVDTFLQADIDSGHEYKCIQNAHEVLNDFYWRLAVEHLKPLLQPAVNSASNKPPNLHYYKIVSASELTVMSVMPFKYSDARNSSRERTLNAKFAFMIAISIMVNWKVNKRKIVNADALKKLCAVQEVIDVKKKGKSFYPLNFKDEHIQWLSDLNTAAPLPVLCNSQTWRMVYFASKALSRVKGQFNP